jgi:hypothetical protein
MPFFIRDSGGIAGPTYLEDMWGGGSLTIFFKLQLSMSLKIKACISFL